MEQFLKTSEIKIGDRVRDDLGDLEALADSIDRNGLIHAVVVDEGKRLIAGGRRLAAVKLLEQRLGKEIPIRAHMLRHVSDRKLRVLELEENLQRKDLTELEKSKNLVELAEKKEAEFMAEMAERAKRKGEEKEEKENCCTPSVQEITPQRGRPEGSVVAGSTTNQARILNIPRQTLREAKQHVEAVEKYPQLENTPKKEAIRTAKILDLNEQRPVDTVNMTSAEFNKHIDKQFKIAGKISDAVFYLATLETDHKTMQAWLDVESDVESIAENRMDELYGQLQRVITNAVKMQTAIKDWREKHGKQAHEK